MASITDSLRHHNGATRRRRALEAPAPPGQRDFVVDEALKALEEDREHYIDKVREAIDDNGITIEVARLRDRLIGLRLGDTERLLLSTPGVTEKLFFKAIEEELSKGDSNTKQTKSRAAPRAAPAAPTSTPTTDEGEAK